MSWPNRNCTPLRAAQRAASASVNSAARRRFRRWRCRCRRRCGVPNDWKAGSICQQFCARAHNRALHAVPAASVRPPWPAPSNEACVGEVVGDAALQPVVVDAGRAHHVLERRVTVGAQGHQLLRRCARTPLSLHWARNCRPQRHCCQSSRGRNSSGASSRNIHFSSLAGACLAVGPGLAIAHRNLGGVGEAGFPAPLPSCRSTTVTSWPRSSRCQAVLDADDAGAQDEELSWRAVSVRLWPSIKREIKLSVKTSEALMKNPR